MEKCRNGFVACGLGGGRGSIARLPRGFRACQSTSSRGIHPTEPFRLSGFSRGLLLDLERFGLVKGMRSCGCVYTHSVLGSAVVKSGEQSKKLAISGCPAAQEDEIAVYVAGPCFCPVLANLARGLVLLFAALAAFALGAETNSLTANENATVQPPSQMSNQPAAQDRKAL